MSDLEEGSVLDEVLGSSSESADGVDTSGSESSEEGNSKPEWSEAIEQLSKQVEGLASLQGKWGNEIGEIRNMYQNQPTPTQTETEGDSDPFLDKLINGGESAVADVVAKVLQNQQSQQTQLQQQVTEQVKGFAPDFEDHHEDIVAAIATDSGASKQQIASSLHTLGPAVLVNAYKRVVAEKKLKEADSLLKAIKSQGTVDFDQAKRALARKPGSGDSFNPPSSTDVPKVDVRSMTADQLNELMKQRGVKQA